MHPSGTEDSRGLLGDAEAPEPGRLPPPARAPGAPVAGIGLWEDDDAPAPRSRRWLLIAALAPWVVLAALLLGRAAGSPSSPDPEAPSPEAASPPAPTAAAAAVAPSTPSVAPSMVIDPTVTTSGARTSARATDAIGIALAVARAHLSRLPTPLTIDGIDSAPDAGHVYLEHVAAEAVDHPGPELVVVTVLAVVLPADGDHYGPAELRRLAVPVRFEGTTAMPAGAPWPLPAPDLTVSAPSPEPVTEPSLLEAAASALADAGYTDVTVTSLGRTATWAWIVEADAIAPNADGPAHHRLWLRSHLGGLAVAGWLPSPHATPTETTTPLADRTPDPTSTEESP